jgi:hypothetical protein
VRAGVISSDINSNFKNKDMSQFKKCKVVMLPTNEKANLHLLGNELGYTKISNSNPLCKQYNFYITSDDEIKEGEVVPYIMCWKDGSYELCNSNNSIRKSKLTYAKKIIATTDSSLKIIKHIPWSKELESPYDVEKGYPKELLLPQPSKSFIEAYVKAYNEGNPITEVMVEYDNHLPDTDNDFGTPVIKKDNTITIRKIKDSWSREEVLTLISKYQNDLGDNCPGIDYEITKWIEQNL